jgi:hypothetical protein
MAFVKNPQHKITTVYKLTPPKEKGKPFVFTLKRHDGEGAEYYSFKSESEANKQRKVMCSLLGIKVRV